MKIVIRFKKDTQLAIVKKVSLLNCNFHLIVVHQNIAYLGEDTTGGSKSHCNKQK